MTEVITYDFEEFECMQHQNIANHWYKTGQPRITIVMKSPMYPILKLGVVLEVTQAVKDSFKSETNDSVKRHIESLINWREQSLKSAVLFT